MAGGGREIVFMGGGGKCFENGGGGGKLGWGGKCFEKHDLSINSLHYITWTLHYIHPKLALKSAGGGHP